ncbi:MAG: hypothetical protein U9Q03_04915 [Patescibacteria group bacterium]|nr:hypothetical protein [Patescibacteria group bacterium]
MPEAAQCYDSGWNSVDFGQSVMEETGDTRTMTDEEKHKISSLADEYSASK